MKTTEYLENPNYMDTIKNIWQEILRVLLQKSKEDIEKERIEQEKIEFVYLVNKAKKDWKDAQNYFNHVTNSELIDLAIYRMEAAQVYYMYLLNEAKRKEFYIS